MIKGATRSLDCSSCPAMLPNAVRCGMCFEFPLLACRRVCPLSLVRGPSKNQD